MHFSALSAQVENVVDDNQRSLAILSLKPEKVA
jgi:hypothetical protein